MTQATAFSGPRFTGSVEVGASGISVFAVPSDPDVEPGMASVTFDPTPDDAEAIAARIWGRTEIMREMEFMTAQLLLPGLEPTSAIRETMEQYMNKRESVSER